jgi:hypothetical protein
VAYIFQTLRANKDLQVEVDEDSAVFIQYVTERFALHFHIL